MLIRYISPLFDPSAIPRTKRDKSKLDEVRTMLPFSMKCNTCSNFMYRGKKFNAKKELCLDEDYMGIRILRFYIKCSVCSAEITFKTDPKNSDYTCESGASRNFENWRLTQEAVDEEKTSREAEEAADSMKTLENRTIDSKIEIDILDALDEIKAINQRHERVNTEALLGKVRDNKESASSGAGLLDEDENVIKSISFKRQRTKRLDESDDEAEGISSATKPIASVDKLSNGQKHSSTAQLGLEGRVVIKRRKVTDGGKERTDKDLGTTSALMTKTNDTARTGPLALDLGCYGSDSD